MPRLNQMAIVSNLSLCVEQSDSTDASKVFGLQVKPPRPRQFSPTVSTFADKKSSMDEAPPE